MRKRFFLIFAILFLCVPVFAQDVKSETDNVELPNIFIWAIPEDDVNAEVDKNTKKNKKEITSEEQKNLSTENEEEPIVLNATTLKGYAEYVEGAEDVLYAAESRPR